MICGQTLTKKRGDGSDMVVAVLHCASEMIKHGNTHGRVHRSAHTNADNPATLVDNINNA